MANFTELGMGAKVRVMPRVSILPAIAASFPAVLPASATAQELSEPFPVTLQESEVDPDVADAAKPASNPGLWVEPSDYPAAALRGELEGTVGFRLIIGKDGKPGNCLITRSSGSDLLDHTACGKLMARARFEPARNAEGEPVVGSWSSAVRWQMPGDAINVPHPEFWIASYVVQSDGEVSQCTVERSEGGAEHLDFCAQLPPFIPYLDEDGNAKAVKVRVMHRLVVDEVSK